MSTLASVVEYGTLASRPSASIPGRVYYTSDTSQIFRDNGTTWDDVTPALSTAAIEAIQNEAYQYAVDSGAANAYAVTLSVAPTLAAGTTIFMKAVNSNTGASTIAVNGGAAKSITKQGSSPLTGGEITGGQVVLLTYDGVDFQLIGGTGGGGGSGTVTSVALTMPTEFSVSGSPVTSSGTLAVTKATQSPNLVYAGPASGSAAAPTFRALVSADLPAISAGGLFSPIISSVPTIAGLSMPTAYNQSGTFTIADTAMGVGMSDTTTGIKTEGIVGAYPATPFTATALFSTPVANTIANAGIVIADTLVGKCVQNCVSVTGSSSMQVDVFNFSAPSTYNSTPYSLNLLVSPFVWLQLSDDGTTITFNMSYDGALWTPVASYARSGSWLGSTGYNYLGIFINPQSIACRSTLMSWKLA